MNIFRLILVAIVAILTMWLADLSPNNESNLVSVNDVSEITEQTYFASVHTLLPSNISEFVSRKQGANRRRLTLSYISCFNEDLPMGIIFERSSEKFYSLLIASVPDFTYVLTCGIKAEILYDNFVKADAFQNLLI